MGSENKKTRMKPTIYISFRKTTPNLDYTLPSNDTLNFFFRRLELCASPFSPLRNKNIDA